MSMTRRSRRVMRADAVVDKVSRHACRRGRLPESNVEFWRAKIRGNQTRDAKAVGEQG